MRVLVTGACGFVGPYLAKELATGGDADPSDSHEVIATVVSEESGSKASCRGESLSQFASQIISLDVTDKLACAEVIKQVKPDAVIHLAGIAFGPDAASNFVDTLRVNVGGVFHVCDALTKHAPNSKLIHISSGEVYGKAATTSLPITEESEPLPMNPYSVTKLQGEEVVRHAVRSCGLEAVIVRPFNHIGPGQSEKFVCPNFAAQLARIAAGKAEPVIHVGNLEAKRDFLDVRDVVRGYRLLLSAQTGVYNLSSGSSISIQEVLDTLIEISGVQVRVEQDPERMRPSEVAEVRGSHQKMTTTLGWSPQFRAAESLKDVYESWKAS